MVIASAGSRVQGLGTFPAIEFEKVNSRLSRCYSERVPLNSVLSKDAPQSPCIIM